MKRAHKGTTRTGAIPTCMAEVSPERSRARHRERMIVIGPRLYAESERGPYVFRFAPIASCTCIAEPHFRATTSIDDCAKRGEA